MKKCEGCGTESDAVKSNLECDLCPRCERILRGAYERHKVANSRDDQCPVQS